MLHMYLKSTPCVLFVWRFSCWELLLRVGAFTWHYCSSYAVEILCSSFSPLSKLFYWGPPQAQYDGWFWVFAFVLVRCCQSPSQGTAIPGSCQQAILGIRNSTFFFFFNLKIEWIPRWDHLLMSFPSICAPSFCPCVSLRQDQFCVEKFEIGKWPNPSTGAHAYIQEVFSKGTFSPLLSIPANVIPVGSWEPLASLASGTF
jgi:hypothetical protein